MLPGLLPAIRYFRPRRHQRSISSVKILKATSGGTPTTTDSVLDHRGLAGCRWSYSPLFRHAFRVCFESLQLISPKTFNLVDPVAKLRERLSPELQQSRARIILNHFLLDEAGHSQDSQVAAHRRTAYIQHIRYFAGT